MAPGNRFRFAPCCKPPMRSILLRIGDDEEKITYVLRSNPQARRARTTRTWKQIDLVYGRNEDGASSL